MHSTISGISRVSGCLLNWTPVVDVGMNNDSDRLPVTLRRRCGAASLAFLFELTRVITRRASGQSFR